MSTTTELVTELLRKERDTIRRRLTRARKLPDRDPHKEILVGRYERELDAHRALMAKRGVK